MSAIRLPATGDRPAFFFYDPVLLMVRDKKTDEFKEAPLSAYRKHWAQERKAWRAKTRKK